MWVWIVLLAFAVWFFVRYLWSDYTPPAFPHAAVPPVRDFTGRDLPMISPTTGELLGKERCATEEEVRAGPRGRRCPLFHAL